MAYEQKRHGIIEGMGQVVYVCILAEQGFIDHEDERTGSRKTISLYLGTRGMGNIMGQKPSATRDPHKVNPNETPLLHLHICSSQCECSPFLVRPKTLKAISWRWEKLTV